jgi:hypothetical protein
MTSFSSVLDVFNNGGLSTNCTPAPTPSPAAGAPVTIVIEGPVQNINVNVITISGIDVVLSSGDPMLATLQIGDIVRVGGNLQVNGATVVIVAVTVVEIDITSVTPTPVPAGSGPVTIVIEGPVQNINVNIVTVSGINVVLNPGDPVLATLQIGDVVRIGGNAQLSGTTIVIVAVTVVIINAPEATATPSPAPETTPEATSQPGGDLPVTIVIEGPVQNINVNIITIYDIDIEVNPSDPILTVIQIGDVIRVEGDVQQGSGNTIIIIAVTVVIVDIDVVVNTDGQVWRDPGNCGNPPPPWAPANGWRRRCQGGGGNGGGNGRGGDDDDD